MNNKNKFIWTTKVSNKGQIVIPKEAREIFTYVSEKNYELFKEFYETKHIKLINGEFNYE